MKKTELPANAENMNAIFTALGALTFALTRRLCAEDQKALLSDLVRLAQARNDAGDLPGETAILDLCRAVTIAPD